MENLNPNDQNVQTNEPIKVTIKDNLSLLFSILFKSPTAGLREYFSSRNKLDINTTIITYVIVFFVYIIGFAIMMGKRADNIDIDEYLKIGLIPVLLMFIISTLSFIIKSTSSPSSFKDDLFTGAVSGVPLMLLMLSIDVVSLFTKNIMKLYKHPLDSGLIAFIILLYIILMMVNIFQQSLKSHKMKESFSWYISPISIIFSFYLAIKIGIEFF